MCSMSRRTTLKLAVGRDLGLLYIEGALKDITLPATDHTATPLSRFSFEGSRNYERTKHCGMRALTWTPGAEV